MVTQPEWALLTLGINAPSPQGHPESVRQNYAAGISRLQASLMEHRFPGRFICWDTDYPPDCPAHEVSPFAFKPACFQQAKRDGVVLAIWADTSVIIRQPLESWFEEIRRQGYLFFRNFHSVGEYCKDEALIPLGIDRAESFRIPSCIGTFMGLNLSMPRSLEFLRRWHDCSLDGVTFPGPKWSGVKGWPKDASTDPRVHGHRFDQTAASVIAWKLGMTEWKPRDLLQQLVSIDRRFVRELKELCP